MSSDTDLFPLQRLCTTVSLGDFGSYGFQCRIKLGRAKTKALCPAIIFYIAVMLAGSAELVERTPPTYFLIIEHLL
jgi:hypothetical protein